MRGRVAPPLPYRTGSVQIQSEQVFKINRNDRSFSFGICNLTVIDWSIRGLPPDSNRALRCYKAAANDG